MLRRDDLDHRRTLRVGVLPLRLEAPPRRRRRIDGVLQRLVGEPPLRLLVPVFVVRLVDDGDQRVGQPVVEARPADFPVSSPNVHGTT